MSFEETYRSPDESVVQFRFKRPKKTCGDVIKELSGLLKEYKDWVDFYYIKERRLVDDELINTVEELKYNLKKKMEELMECV